MKTALIRDRIHPYCRESTSIVTHALPFWKSRSGLLVHRVRSGQLHRLGADHHISLRFWCGMHGFLAHQRTTGRRSGGDLFAQSPDRAIHCAVCEGKAIGAGLDGTRQINGRPVLFSARI